MTFMEELEASKALGLSQCPWFLELMKPPR